MRKIISTIAIAFIATLFANAQDRLEPGIYAVADSCYTSLSFSAGINKSSSTNIFGVEVGDSGSSYKGETSGVNCTGCLVMVIDPDKKVIKRTLKSYEPFIKTMTPDLIMIVPLTVEKNKRTYNAGKSVMGIKTEKKERVPFEWEQIDDVTFRINFEAAPGEYAVVFKAAKLGDYDFASIYGFTIAE